jgi:hypothetical protein
MHMRLRRTPSQVGNGFALAHSEENNTILLVELGAVAFWHKEGWGAITAPERP